MRKVDATTYEPVEQAESMEVELSRTQVTTVFQGVVVVAVTFVLLWWVLSRVRS